MPLDMSPDSLSFFCCITASVVAAFGAITLYQQCRNRRRRTDIAAAAVQEERHPHTIAATLPPFMYNRLVRHVGRGAGGTDCAVCLSLIRVGAMVKLLPVCGHIYHAECIDRWLSSHSTCPLCRSEADPFSTGREPTRQLPQTPPLV